MLFMVVEHFKPGRVRDIYRIAKEQGRGLPDGLIYIDSWVEAGLGRCFQLMECDDASLLQEWVLGWDEHDVGRFEIVPVVQSKQTFEVVERVAGSLASSAG